MYKAGNHIAGFLFFIIAAKKIMQQRFYETISGKWSPENILLDKRFLVTNLTEKCTLISRKRNHDLFSNADIC
jgi:hypothetical protein